MWKKCWLTSSREWLINSTLWWISAFKLTAEAVRGAGKFRKRYWVAFSGSPAESVELIPDNICPCMFEHEHTLCNWALFLPCSIGVTLTTVLLDRFVSIRLTFLYLFHQDLWTVQISCTSVGSALFHNFRFSSWLLRLRPRPTCVTVFERPNEVICVSSLCFPQVSAEMVRNPQCLPHVQQAHLSPPAWPPTSTRAATESPGGLRGEHTVCPAVLHTL